MFVVDEMGATCKVHEVPEQLECDCGPQPRRSMNSSRLGCHHPLPRQISLATAFGCFGPGADLAIDWILSFARRESDWPVLGPIELRLMACDLFGCDLDQAIERMLLLRDLGYLAYDQPETFHMTTGLVDDLKWMSSPLVKLTAP